MQRIELELLFREWLREKTGEELQINNIFLLVCLDEAIEQKLNSTFNGVPFHQLYSHEQFMNQILQSWQSTAGSFLQLTNPNVSINFRNVGVPDFAERQELLNQLSQLVVKVNA